MSGYWYNHGFQSYKRSLNELTPRVRRIITLLSQEQGWGRLSRIARQVEVSRCFVWQIEHRLEQTVGRLIKED